MKYDLYNDKRMDNYWIKEWKISRKNCKRNLINNKLYQLPGKLRISPSK